MSDPFHRMVSHDNLDDRMAGLEEKITSLEGERDNAVNTVGLKNVEISRLRRALRRIADNPFLSADDNAGFADDILAGKTEEEASGG